MNIKVSYTYSYRDVLNDSIKCKHTVVMLISPTLYNISHLFPNQVIIMLCIGYVSCWPRQTATDSECGLAESTTLFDRMTSTRDSHIKKELTFMAEFAQFMNHKTPQLLEVTILP